MVRRRELGLLKRTESHHVLREEEEEGVLLAPAISCKRRAMTMRRPMHCPNAASQGFCQEMAGHKAAGEQSSPRMDLEQLGMKSKGYHF